VEWDWPKRIVAGTRNVGGRRKVIRKLPVEKLKGVKMGRGRRVRKRWGKKKVGGWGEKERGGKKV